MLHRVCHFDFACVLYVCVCLLHMCRSWLSTSSSWSRSWRPWAALNGAWPRCCRAVSDWVLILCYILSQHRHSVIENTKHWCATNIITIFCDFFLQFYSFIYLNIVTRVCWCAGQADSSLSESEDDNPEALRPMSHYTLCEQPQPDPDLLLSLPTTPPPSPRLLHSSQAVVISQPAPLCSPRQPSDETHPHVHSSESASYMDYRVSIFFL